MPAERRFEPAGRAFAPVATILGLFLVADAVWCVHTGQLWAAVVVGGVGLERLVYAATDYWHRRLWAFRLVAARLAEDGLTFEERNAYTGASRETVMPVGLVLEARVERGSERGLEASWGVLLLTILGTIVWSEHEDEESADAELARLREVLDARADPELTPPVATDAIDIIEDQRGVMWGAPPWVPLSIVARVVLLLATIVAVPNLAGGMASMMLWGLTALTVLLLAFPLVGAVALLRRRGGLMAYGATAQFGELRAWERSGVSQIVPIRHVYHVGFGDMVLSGAPIAMRLVAHTEQDTAIEALVPRSAAANLAEQACRLLAEMHEIGGNRPEWSVRLPGGIAEAIEAVSWVQRFVAEARQERAEIMD